MPQESNEWKKKDIQKQSDNKIDQDFPGFPHGMASEQIINPSSEEEKKIAALKVKDGEKENKKKPGDDGEDVLSIGSGGAFDSTENMTDDEEDSRDGK